MARNGFHDLLWLGSMDQLKVLKVVGLVSTRLRSSATVRAARLLKFSATSSDTRECLTMFFLGFTN